MIFMKRLKETLTSNRKIKRKHFRDMEYLRLQCELWVTCTNPQCFQSGCANVLAQQSMGVKS